MTTEMTPRKTCGHAILKSLPPDQQEEIATYARENTLVETRAYLAREHKITVSIHTIGRFRAWYDDELEAELIEDSLERVIGRLEKEHPDWTPKKIETAGQAYFAAYAIQRKDVRAWWQIQQLELKKKRLALDREKFERNAVENIVNTASDPKVLAVAQNGKLSYAEKIAELNEFMFGDEDEGDESPESDVQSPELSGQVGKGEKEKEGAEDNIEHPTPNIQHPVAEGKVEEVSPESNVPSQSNAVGGMENADSAATCNLQSSTVAEAPTSKPQAPEKIQTSNAAADSQTSTNNPQPAENVQPLEAAGSFSRESATEFLTAVYSQARQIGLRLPKPWHVASLRAYLTGQEMTWLNPKNLQKEPVPPPALDPRLDPESPWSRLWKNLERAMNENEKN